MEQEKISIFKPSLLNTQVYKGGKSRSKHNSAQKIYKLSSNENILGPSPKAIEAIQDCLLSLNEYPDNTDLRLKAELSKYYNNQLDVNQFVTSNSGVEMIEMICRAFLDEGLECIISNPAFEPYISFSQKEGARIKDIPLVGDQFELNIEGILNAITSKTRLIFITSPNNPTGTIISKNQIEQLLNQLPKHVILVLDEVYHHFVESRKYTIGMPYVLKEKQVISINSFSKAFGLAGLRIGYAYSTPEIAYYLNQIRRPFMLSTIALEASIAALKDQEFINKIAITVREGKRFLYRELYEIGIKFWKSEANFVLIKPEMEETLFEQKMLEQGVMVRPVSNFGAPGCVRVTIGDTEANTAFIKGLKIVLSHNC